MTVLIGIQRRMMQLGRVRIGEQVAYEKDGQTKYRAAKLDTFRFTSASKPLLDAVAETYGGTVKAWEGAPEEGYYEVVSEASDLNIVLPPVFAQADGSPTTSWSQWFELWTAAGCQRRCDGVTEALSGEPCSCNPDGRECKITTRVSFMLPEIPGLGVWRLDSHGINAAIELPGTLEVLMMAAHEQQFIPAVLRIEHRTKKVVGEKYPRRFIVPVIDLPELKVGELLAGRQPVAINAPAVVPERPELPAAVDLPDDPAFAEQDQPGWGEPPVPEAETSSESPLTALELTMRLYALAETLGKKQPTVDKVVSHRKSHTAEEHLGWLERQVQSAEKKTSGVPA